LPLFWTKLRQNDKIKAQNDKTMYVRAVQAYWSQVDGNCVIPGLLEDKV